VSVCEREIVRKRERVCVCVCERERERERNRETLGRKTHRLPTIVDAPRTLVAEVAVGGVGSDDGDAPRPDHQRAISMRLFRV